MQITLWDVTPSRWADFNRRTEEPAALSTRPWR